jgi:hypothetical protein
MSNTKYWFFKINVWWFLHLRFLKANFDFLLNFQIFFMFRSELLLSPNKIINKSGYLKEQCHEIVAKMSPWSSSLGLN